MTHPDDLYAACFMLKLVIETVREDYPATAAKLAGIEDYLRSCVEDEPEVTRVDAYIPKGE